MMNSKSIVLSHIDTLVLDEADKFMEMGFQEELSQVLKLLKTESEIEHRQTILLSATLNQDIKELGELALTKPVIITESKQQDSVNANLKLTHYFARLPEGEKRSDNDRSACLLTLCLKHFAG